MKKKHILLLFVVLLLALATPASATQYNPPWAHNYGFLYPASQYGDALDTRSYAYSAGIQQYNDGYSAYYSENFGAYNAFSNIKDDAVFFFIGHGQPGLLYFYNGTTSFMLAQEYDGHQNIPYPHYFLSSTTTELNDVLLAVFVACHSGATDPVLGNLVDTSYQKGVDNTIGFERTIYYPYVGYWSDRFWYRCLYGALGSPQSFKDASNGATMDVLMDLGDFYNTQYKYSKLRVPYNYLNPARYGVV